MNKAVCATCGLQRPKGDAMCQNCGQKPSWTESVAACGNVVGKRATRRCFICGQPMRRRGEHLVCDHRERDPHRHVRFDAGWWVTLAWCGAVLLALGPTAARAWQE